MNDPLSRDEAVLLARYGAAKFILQRTRWPWRLKYLLLALGVALLLLAEGAWIGAVAVTLLATFLVVALVQRWFHRAVARFGQFDRLREFDLLASGIVDGLQAELRRAQSASRLGSLLVTVVRYTRGHLAAVELTEWLYGVDVARLLPAEDVAAARRALADAAG